MNGKANRFSSFTCGDQLIVDPMEKVDDPILQKLELGCLYASGSPALEVIRDLNASFRPILDGGGKSDGRPAPRGLLARVDGHLELGLVLRRERSSREKAGHDDEEDSSAFHGYILVQFADYIQTITRRHSCRTNDDPFHKRWVAYAGMI